MCIQRVDVNEMREFNFLIPRHVNYYENKRQIFGGCRSAKMPVKRVLFTYQCYISVCSLQNCLFVFSGYVKKYCHFQRYWHNLYANQTESFLCCQN